MNTYPATPAPRLGTKESTISPLLKSTTDANYIKVRRLATKSRKKFELKYSPILEDEYNVLETFFLENQGVPFTFIHPISGVAYTCTFTQDELTKEFITNKTFGTEVRIEEV